MTFALGCPVRFTHVLERDDVYLPEKPDKEKNQQHWLSVPREGQGILVGLRNKSNGYTDHYSYNDEDGGGYERIWTPTGFVKCALVVTNLYRNHVFVPLDSLEVL